MKFLIRISIWLVYSLIYGITKSHNIFIRMSYWVVNNPHIIFISFYFASWWPNTSACHSRCCEILLWPFLKLNINKINKKTHWSFRLSFTCKLLDGLLDFSHPWMKDFFKFGSTSRPTPRMRRRKNSSGKSK